MSAVNGGRAVVAEEGRKWDTFSACSVVEGFDGEPHSEEEILEAWQYLVDTGVVWSLQGWYGRTAASLIQAGVISPAAGK